jgi:Mg-chelatase subunit ChlD
MRSIKMLGFLGILLGVGTAGVAQQPGAAVTDAIAGKARVELVFVLDTTGSMGGLIEGAKSKIWGIVNDVMKAPGRPEVRIGLVAYRDHGDAYVTKVEPITRDLDKIYSVLMDYKAEGGGDGPEDVRQALADGLKKVGWSSPARGQSQIMFLVGDAQPHDDYANEPDTAQTARDAVKLGIIVNTIQCGNDPNTRVVWNKVASMGEGQYFAIAQDGGVVAIKTPYDDELAKLGAKSGATYMAFGTGVGGMSGAASRAKDLKEQAAIEDKVVASAPAQAKAERAYNKAINSSAYNERDLVQGIESGKVKLSELKVEELPDELQKLSSEERHVVVAKKMAERKAIQAQILDLGKKRDAYMAEERKKLAGKDKNGFDEAVSQALKEQISRTGSKR